MTGGEVLAGSLGCLWLLAHALGAIPRPGPPHREPVVVYPPPVPRRTP